ADGHTAPEVARRLGTSRRTVRLWRGHWLARPGEAVGERLQDAPRPGAPATFRARPWCQIMALGCEPPEAAGRPISHWTPRELADEARKRGHCRDNFRAPCGAFFKITPISSRTAVATGSIGSQRMLPMRTWPMSPTSTWRRQPCVQRVNACCP